MYLQVKSTIHKHTQDAYIMINSIDSLYFNQHSHIQEIYLRK